MLQHVLPAITGSKFDSFRSNRFNKLNFLQEIIGFFKFLQCIFVYQVKGFLDYVFESFKWQKNQGKCYMLVP